MAAPAPVATALLLPCVFTAFIFWEGQKREVRDPLFTSQGSRGGQILTRAIVDAEFSEPCGHIKELNLMAEQGQSFGTELPGQEVFSCFMSNFNPLPGWPLAFSFLNFLKFFNNF